MISLLKSFCFGSFCLRSLLNRSFCLYRLCFRCFNLGSCRLFLCCRSCCRCRFRLRCRRSECSLNSILRAFVHTQTTSLALILIDICQVAFDSDCLKLADFRAFTTADAGILTSLHSYSTLVMVDAAHPHTAMITTHEATLLAKFDDEFRTSLHTCATSDTLLFINHRKSGLFIDVNGIKCTSHFAIAQTDTAKCATGLAGKRSRSHCTTLGAIVV